MKIQILKVGELETNCYFLISENEVLIVDPGGDSEKILEKIKELDKENKYIILTHYHFDHSQDAQVVKNKTGAEIIAHKDDSNLLNFAGVGVDRLLAGGEKLKFNQNNLKVIHTPGHTEGSICLLGDTFLITGDTLFENGYGRTDLPGGSSRKMRSSLEKIKLLLVPGMTIYPGHGPFFNAL